MESIQNNYNPLNTAFSLPKEKAPFHQRYQTIEIDLIDACQLKCNMCLRQERENINENLGKIDHDNLIDFIYNNQERIRLIKLIGVVSEPTLYNKINELINYINHLDISVQICTNGNLNNNSFWIHLASNLNQNAKNELIFAIEGSTEELYQMYRKNGSLKQVLKNINLIMMSRPKFKLGIQFIKFNFNINEEFNIIELLNSKNIYPNFIDIYHCNEPTTLEFDIGPREDIIKKFYKGRILINTEISSSNLKTFDTTKISCKSEYYGELFIDPRGYIWPCTNLFEYYYRNNFDIPEFIKSIKDFDNEIPKYYFNNLEDQKQNHFECFKSCSNIGHKLEIPFLKERVRL